MTKLPPSPSPGEVTPRPVPALLPERLQRWLGAVPAAGRGGREGREGGRPASSPPSGSDGCAASRAAAPRQLRAAATVALRRQVRQETSVSFRAHHGEYFVELQGKSFVEVFSDNRLKSKTGCFWCLEALEPIVSAQWISIAAFLLCKGLLAFND